MRPLPLILFAAMLAAPMLATATDPVPEIERAAAAPQQTGALHALRTIPEACARLQGEFSDDPKQPYRFAVVRTSAACQARARLLDAEKAKPSAAAGWLLNDRIRVPSAACPSLSAVVEVWRRDTTTEDPGLDAQGKARIYLREGIDKARAGQLAALPVYAAALSLQGHACD